MISPFFLQARAASHGCLYPMRKAFSTSLLCSTVVKPPSASDLKKATVEEKREDGYPKTITLSIGWEGFGDMLSAEAVVEGRFEEKGYMESVLLYEGL